MSADSSRTSGRELHAPDVEAIFDVAREVAGASASLRVELSQPGRSRRLGYIKGINRLGYIKGIKQFVVHSTPAAPLRAAPSSQDSPGSTTPLPQ